MLPSTVRRHGSAPAARRVPLGILCGVLGVGLALATASPASARRVVPDLLRAPRRREAEQAVPVLPHRPRPRVPRVRRSARRRRPRAAFDTSLLTSYTGTAAQLRNAVTDVVKDDYCEFNVQVRPTTTAPPATFARRNTVAIGTDSNPAGFGIAENVDLGDAFAVDSARVWAGTYQDVGGGAGGALNGASSTLQRWARGIGGTAAHEAGHNYGLSHSHDATSAAGRTPPPGTSCRRGRR